jgi:hypothetical protein
MGSGQVATESFVDPDTGIETEMLRIERDPGPHCRCAGLSGDCCRKR